MDQAETKRALTANLLTTGRRWRRAVDLRLSGFSISEASAAPLIGISRLGGGVRQNALAVHLGIEGPSLVRVIDQLETLILVERRAYPGDRRAKGLWLTDEGRKVAAMIEAELDLMRQRILAHVDQLDIVATLRVFRAFEDLECI